MTLLLHIPARDDAPLACDMRAARDTLDAREREYAALLATALVHRERNADAVVLRFRQRARAQVIDLARREAACCPFVDYRVERSGDEIVWTTASPQPGGDHSAIDVMLDALYALPDHAGGFFDRLAEDGIAVVEHRPDRFEFRRVVPYGPTTRGVPELE